MDAPVSWLLIHPGWKVYAVDGSQVGEVDEVAGDDTIDIFDGLALATSPMGTPRYVRAEHVERITDGVVHLSLSAGEVALLGEYGDPATSASIEADNRGGAMAEAAGELRETVGKVVRPLQRHEHSMNVWRRMYLLLRRRIGR